jgi:transcriptional regulator GlxA family with amidase domain
MALRWIRRPRSAGKLSTADPRYRDVVEALRMHMEAHYGSPDFSTAEAAGALHMSERKLQMILKNAGVRPFREILNDFRLTRAAELLTGTARSVAEIGSEVGFSRPDVFSRQFRAKFGMSASDYRKSAPFRRPPS